MKARAIIAILWGLVAFILSGCSVQRNIASSTKDAAHTEENRTETTAGEIRRTVDSTKSEGVEVTYTKVEFFPPEPDTQQVKPDTTQTAGPSVAGTDVPKDRPKEPKDKQPPNATGKQGAIKSIETFTITQKTEAAGTTKEEQKTGTTKAEEVNTDTDTTMDVTDKPAADPYRWRYIFGILAILTVAFFFFRKSKIFTFFRELF